ncbi:MAG: hypothetical protein PHO27_07510 [Sulfuricurvum sp.]|nr:hypothetical protein [Sulfuricurvum sp.]
MKTIFTSLIFLMPLIAFSGCCGKNACEYNERNIIKADCYKNPNASERQECYSTHNEPFNPNQNRNFN